MTTLPPVAFDTRKIGITSHVLTGVKFTSTFIGNGKSQAMATVLQTPESLAALQTVYSGLVAKYFEGKPDGQIKPLSDENGSVNITFPKRRKSTMVDNGVEAEIKVTKNNFTVSQNVGAVNAQITADTEHLYNITVRLSPWSFTDQKSGITRAGATLYAVSMTDM